MSCQQCLVGTEDKFAPTSAVINLTDECNFRCPYCFTTHKPRRASLETVEAAAFWLINNVRDSSQKPNLWFFGGEPMLEYKSIIVPMVNKFDRALSFGITTNGSLLCEDVIDFFYENEVQILLSIDGTEKVQNYQRPYVGGKPSFADVCKNIPYLLLKYPNQVFRATLTKFSIPYMNEAFDFAEHLGFRNITFVINESEDYEEEDYSEMEKQYNRIALKMLKGSPLRCNDFYKIHEFLRMEPNSVYRCGYGTTAVGITSQGDITPCQELNTIDEFIIGNVFSGIDNEKRKAFFEKINKPLLVPKGCGPQLERILRNGVCPKKAYFDFGFSVTEPRLKQLDALRKCYNKIQTIARYSGNFIWKEVGFRDEET